jgi:hypothetical protein
MRTDPEAASRRSSRWHRGRTFQAVVNTIVLALIADPALAGSITIRNDVSALAQGDRLTVTMRIVNSGDEAAHAVAAGASFGGQATRGPTQPILVPGGRMEISLELPGRPTAAGQWPLAATVDYTDANGYAFQALHVLLVSSVDASPALVAVVDVDARPLATSSGVDVRLKSLSGIKRPTTINFFVPRGLEVDIASRPFSLEPWSDATVKAQITNRTALPGSRYPVFVTVEYDDPEGHHAALAQGTIEIRAARAARGIWFFGAAATLTVVWLLIARRRRTAPPAA